MFEQYLPELLVTVVGGVVTAIILNMFSGSKNKHHTTNHNQSVQQQSRGPSAIGQFIHMALALVVGFALALPASRMLFKADILNRSVPNRILVLVVAVALVWWILLLFRGKR